MNRDCCTWDGKSMGHKKTRKIKIGNYKNSLLLMEDRAGPHLSSCGIIAPLDVELWQGRERGREGSLLKLKDILVTLEIHGWDCASGPYLGSEQHVVHQLHVRLHLCSLNVVQVVTQRVTLEKQKNKKQRQLKKNANAGLALQLFSEIQEDISGAGLVISAPSL